MLSKKEKEFCLRNGIKVLKRRDYPPLLKEIADPPERLFVQGNVRALFLPCLGLVGTRKPSSYGVRSALHFSKALSAHFCVVSGLARGIDSAAHKGALLGKGKTVAVLAHGHDQIYPRENLKLAKEILKEGGALISEYPPYTECKRHYFVARNRIVAGLSCGVVVIEAGEKSGSLITANFANDSGRDVFVVPGPYDDLNYKGSHELIQTGAKLVQSTLDVLQEYPHQIKKAGKQKKAEESNFFRKIFKKEFSFEELFEFSLKEGFSPSLQLKKWLDNKLIAETSPQVYMWLN